MVRNRGWFGHFREHRIAALKGKRKTPLSTYNKKRNFKKTLEPKGKIGKGTGKFFVQEHHARNQHWDLRLEKNGVLESWAVPKNPSSATTKHKLLAVKVEDHPISYGNFEGKIPEGNYGAGTVKVWDKGKYNAEKFTPKEILADFSGKRLKGRYNLIKFKDEKNNWMFMKGKEELK